MLFNSYEFLLCFLPIVLAVFWWLGRSSHQAALWWLTFTSVVFYGWQIPGLLILLAVSLFFNFGMSHLMERFPAEGTVRRMLLFVGIAINLGFIGYFKYAMFLVQNLNWLFGTSIVLNDIVLPIGISFYTFHQIAYLVERHRNETPVCSFRDYCLYVTFFPQLIAGPIVRPKEMLPQLLASGVFRPQAANIAIGLTIFSVGLFKKTVIADGLIPFSSGVFSTAEMGPSPSLIEAWSAALAYTLQLYFDFSGYSDMAIGLGRLFGIHLPVNFDSPYKATNIIDFWRRWHMTLSRFLRDYVYIPLGGGRTGPTRRYINLMLTMLIGGLWHGAGWTFVLWGGLHGMYLVLNHGWNALKSITGLDQRPARWWHVIVARGLTFLAILLGWVLFRAESLAGAEVMFQSMLGLNGISLPVNWFSRWGIPCATMENFEGWSELVHLAVLLAVVWLAPNTQQIMADWQPTYEAVSERERANRPAWAIWKPTPRWAVVCSAMTVLAILQISRASEFLYFQF